MLPASLGTPVAHLWMRSWPTYPAAPRQHSTPEENHMTRHAPRTPRRIPTAVSTGPTLSAQKTLAQWRAEYRARRTAATATSSNQPG